MVDSRRRAQGFTLVELMVVIVIIGLAAAAVVLAMPEQGGSLRSEAVRFAARAKAARDTAILQSRPVAVAVGPAGYEIRTRERGAWRTDARYEWTGPTRPAAAISIRFDETGLAEPAAILLRRGERRALIEIAGDGRVHVRP